MARGADRGDAGDPSAGSIDRSDAPDSSRRSPGSAGRAAVPSRHGSRVLRAAALVLAALVAIPSADVATAAEPTPLEVFRQFIRDRDPSLRRKAVQALAEERGADVVDALLLAARDEDSTVADKAVAILQTPRDRSDEIAALTKALSPKVVPATRAVAARALAVCGRVAIPALRTAARDRDPVVAAIAARALGTSGDRDLARDLHELLTSGHALVRAAACESIGVLLRAEAVGTASAVALGDSAAEPRIVAVEILARHPADDTVSHVVRCLSDEDWSLRTASARALTAYRGSAEAARAAVAALVPALQREPRNRVRVEISATLWDLTGIDFGPDPARWLAWFRETGGKFDPPPKRPVRRARDAGATFGGLGDLPLESEHVCFVFDASSSMNDPVRFGAKRTKRDDLRDAFEAVLEKLPKASWINLIPFATVPAAMKPALFEATPSARKATLRHLEKTPADGRTNIYDAVELALRDPDADTLVVLTDGAPSAGARTGRTAILDGVRELNRYRLARIHTVEIGAASTGARWKGFLADLAEAGGGHHLAR